MIFFENRNSKLIHAERMAAIERGISPASLDEKPFRVYLRRGLFWFFPGAGLTLYFWLAAGDLATPWGAACVLMTSVGLAYLLYWFLGRREA